MSSSSDQHDSQRQITGLQQLLDHLADASHDGVVITFGQIIEPIGQRSFGPLLLLAGVITLLPIIGDIPGVPTLMAVFVVLIAGQLLFFRTELWLPKWILRRSVPPDKFHKSLEWMRGPARFIDRLLWPRLTIFVHPVAIYAIAVACVMIAAAMPAMEFIPFSANLAGAALTAFGLALIARDGLLALVAFVLTAGSVGAIVYYMF